MWDEELKKFCSWSQLVCHPDLKIAKRWNRSGINEFARLFQGYGDIEGIDVLDWIFFHEVPKGQTVRGVGLVMVVAVMMVMAQFLVWE